MKLKSGFVLRKVADTYVVVAVGAEAKKHNVMITLNETGRFLWEHLEKGATEEELVSALLGEYDVSEDDARESVSEFVEKLVKNGFLE
jgi:sensor domain CHASE-containing protein